ncbi:hypothetical protein B0H14DRAFT_1445194 [Mycena olivaceomarginata]|nr:hypothetical protein B0H14DRAFT_1445194 [Mycena olivaceomarginata]
MAAPPAVPHLDLDPQQGGFLIGVFFSVFLFGIATVQTWIFEAVHTALACHAAYWWLAINFLNPANLGVSVWSADITLFFSGIIALIVHIFFAWRIWTLSHGSIWIPGLIIAVALGSLGKYRMCRSIQTNRRVLGCTFTTSALSVQAKTFAGYPAKIPISSAALALDCGADLLTAISISVYLNKGRSGMKATDHLVNKLIFWCMNSNLIFLAIFEVVASAYANSLLATLNIRAIQRSQVLGEDGNSLELGSSIDFRVPKQRETLNTTVQSNIDLGVEVPRRTEHSNSDATMGSFDTSLGKFNKSEPKFEA